MIQSPRRRLSPARRPVRRLQVRAGLPRRRLPGPQHVLRAAARSWAATSSRSGSTSGPASSSRRTRPTCSTRTSRSQPLEGVRPAHRPAVDAVRSPRVLRTAGDPVPRVGAGQRVLLDRPRQGRHGDGHARRAARLLGRHLLGHAAAPVQRAAGQLRRSRARVTWSPLGPIGATEFRVHRVRGARAVPRVGDAAGLQRQDPERDRELQPVDVPLPGDGDRRDDQGQRGRRRSLAAGAALRLLCRRHRPPHHAGHRPRRYTSVGAWGQVGVDDPR